MSILKTACVCTYYFFFTNCGFLHAYIHAHVPADIEEQYFVSSEGEENGMTRLYHNTHKGAELVIHGYALAYHGFRLCSCITMMYCS